MIFFLISYQQLTLPLILTDMITPTGFFSAMMGEWIPGHIFFYPFLGAVVVALICGPLGSFMVWQRLSALSDSLAHTTLLGIALSLILSCDVWWGLLLTPLMAALLLSCGLRASPTGRATTDSLLIVISQGALVLSLLILSTTGLSFVDFTGYLLGDVLTLQSTDVLIILFGGCGLMGVIFLLWKPLLILTLQEDLAAAQGYRVFLLRLTLLAVMALALGFVLRVMGALLLSTLLIFPALTARTLAHSPEAMCIWASGLAVLWVVLGFAVSFSFDIPTGPAIGGFALVGLCWVSFCFQPWKKSISPAARF